LLFVSILSRNMCTFGARKDHGYCCSSQSWASRNMCTFGARKDRGYCCSSQSYHATCAHSARGRIMDIAVRLNPITQHVHIRREEGSWILLFVSILTITQHVHTRRDAQTTWCFMRSSLPSEQIGVTVRLYPGNGRLASRPQHRLYSQRNSVAFRTTYGQTSGSTSSFRQQPPSFDSNSSIQHSPNTWHTGHINLFFLVQNLETTENL
jgi:hypothetical protein